MATEKISRLKKNPNNPRKIDEHQLKKLIASIKDFPDMLEARPIVVNPDMVVLGGNMRLEACKRLGIKEVPVYIATWDEVKNKEFIIKDNIGYGEWDWDALSIDWDGGELSEWGLSVPQFDEGGGDEDSGNFEDPGRNIEERHGVLVECESERDQELVYERLKNEGYKCRILSV